VCAVLDDDPGLMDDEIRFVASIMGLSLLFALCPLLFLGGVWRDFIAAIVVFSIINPICFAFAMWLYLIIEKRRVSKSTLAGDRPYRRRIGRGYVACGGVALDLIHIQARRLLRR